MYTHYIPFNNNNSNCINFELVHFKLITFIVLIYRYEYSVQLMYKKLKTFVHLSLFLPVISMLFKPPVLISFVTLQLLLSLLTGDDRLSSKT